VSEKSAAPDLDQMARDVLDSVRYVMLGTIDEDGRTRTSPVHFTPHGYEDLYWVSNGGTHHSNNLHRDPRLRRGLRLEPATWEDEGGLRDRCGARGLRGRFRAAPAGGFDAEGRGGLRFEPEEVVGDADLRLWVRRVESWKVHIGAGHPTLGTGQDRRVPVDPRPGRRA
jgi:Pyridoxamine 5'-phosphate oxidase